MGCASSSPTQISQKQETSKQPQVEMNHSFNPEDSFLEILKNVNTIEEVRNMTPIVCLSHDSFPLITSRLKQQNSSAHSISLPIVAASICGKGRVVCFSQLNLIQPQFAHTADNFTLLANIVHWTADCHDPMTTLFSLGFNKTELLDINNSFHRLGIYVEKGHLNPDIQSYKAIIIPSNADLTDPHKVDQLYKYVHDDGGGLIVFSNHNNLHYFLPVNNLLSKFNLSYTFCLINNEIESTKRPTVDTSNHLCSDLIFPKLIIKFKSILNETEIDVRRLDDIVTTLRYHVMVCDETFYEELQEINESAWNYLIKTGYRNDELICPDIKHGIIIVLLLEISTKLPQNCVKPIPDHESFPGKTADDVELSNFNISLDLQNETWASTGLYLPAGVVGTVELENGYNSNIYLQIGSHHENLLSKENPWKRWPLITSIYHFRNKVINVVSSFGGIVYISYKLGYSNNSQTAPIRLNFTNFTKYPIYDYAHPKILEKTKDIKVPWGEIATKFVIFTVPSDFLRSIKNFEKINDFFTKIVENIQSLMSVTIEKPFRFVFDIDLLTGQPSCGYPLVFGINDINDILISFDKPSHKLFVALTFMSICSIREDCMDRITETAVATVVAAEICRKLYPDFDPANFDNFPFPALFAELWEIHTKVDNEVIFKTLAAFQDPNFAMAEVEEDMLIQFVVKLCEIGKMNFTRLLDRAYPVPLNISLSIEGLPMY